MRFHPESQFGKIWYAKVAEISPSLEGLPDQEVRMILETKLREEMVKFSQSHPKKNE